MIKRKDRKGKVFRLTRSLRGLGRSVARKSRVAVARSVMRDKRTRKKIMSILQKDLKRELELMCSVKHNSILMSTSPKSLKHFTWEKLEEELKSTAPNLHSVLEGALDVHRPPCKVSQSRKNVPSKSAIMGVCAAILCRFRHHAMNNVQRLVSLLLYKGGANKQVV